MDAAVEAWLSQGSRFAIPAAAIVAIALVGSAYVSRDESGLESPARTLAPGLVRLDAPEVRGLLFDSEAHAAFLPLISNFATQKPPDRQRADARFSPHPHAIGRAMKRHWAHPGVGAMRNSLAFGPTSSTYPAMMYRIRPSPPVRCIVRPRRRHA